MSIKGKSSIAGSNSIPRAKYFYGWIIVAASFILEVLAWGSQYSFGIFFTSLCSDMHWSRTVVSSGYSLSIGWHGITYLVAGIANDRYGPHRILLVCIVLLAAGYALMSQISALWQFYIFYGLLIGTGIGLIYVPLASTITHWFIEKRGLALGIATAGVGVGTLVFAPFAQFLITEFDWSASYLIIAGIILVVGLPLTRSLRLNPSEKGLLPYGMEKAGQEKNTEHITPIVSLTIRQAFKEKSFWLLVSGGIFIIICIQMIMVHVKNYATDIGIAPMVAATILGVIGGGGIAGRVIVGGVSDRIGRINSLVICSLLMAVMMLWLVKAREPWQFYLFSAIFGFSYGGCVPLLPGIVGDLFGMKYHGSILGMLIGIEAVVGGAVGPLLAGYVHDTTGSYDLALMIVSALLFVAVILTLLLKKVKLPNLGESHE